MPKPLRRAQPARAFAVTLLLLSLLAAISFLKHYISIATQRSSYNVLNQRDLASLSGGHHKPCRKIHESKDQCAYFRKYCEDEDIGLLSYLGFYYCDLPHVKPIAFGIVATWTALLFTTIGVAASDFFCVNLSTISNILGLSESMAGVTFLAFGNGSPDVFSTFAAVKSNSASLAVGELLGAAGFITAVVSGSMALVRSFKVPKRSFVRDVSFFAVAVAFSVSFISNGKLELWECAVMVGYYIFYVITVVIWHWWLGRRRRQREQRAMIRGHYVHTDAGDVDYEEEYHDEDEPQTTTRGTAQHASNDDFDDLEQAGEAFPRFSDVDYAFVEESERGKLMGELSSNMRLNRPRHGRRPSVFNPIRPSLVGALEFQSVLQSLKRSRNIQSVPLNWRRYSDDPYVISEQSETRSVSSDPQETSYYDDSTHGALEPDKLSTQDAGFGGGLRNRSVSADAAGVLTSPSRSNRKSVGLHPHFEQSPESSTQAPINLMDDAEPSDAALVKPPQVSISPATPMPLSDLGSTDQQTCKDSSKQSPLRTGFLTPPDPRPAASRQARDSNDLDESRKKTPSGHSTRPLLTLTPPDSSMKLHRHTPRQSPLAGGLDGPANISMPSLLLPPVASPEGVNEASILEEPKSKPLRWWPYGMLPAPSVLGRTLFPTLCDWRQKNIWGKLAGLASAPSFLLLAITLPVVEPQAVEEDAPKGLFPETSDDATASKSQQGAQTKRRPRASTSETHSPLLSPRLDALAQLVVNAEERYHHRHHPHPSSLHVPTNQSLTHSTAHSPSASSPTAYHDDHTTEQRQETSPEEPHYHAAVHTPYSWNRWLVLVQTFTAPYTVVLAVWFEFYTPASPRTLIYPTLYSLLGSAVCAALILVTTTPARPPRWHFFLCFAGFAVSVTWIATIANEVVGVLKALGVIFNISDALLGLTIFAVGNSLGDLVADITVARLGFPVMALSACFGGPMLNILLGVGLSGLYMVLRGAAKDHEKHPGKDVRFKPYHVEVSLTLLVSAVGLLVTLLGLLIAVPLNGWRMDWRVGTGLIVLWVLSTAGNVAVELLGVEAVGFNFGFPAQIG